MLSNLRASDAPALAAFARDRTPTSPMWAHWRGRLGLTEEQQARVWAHIQANFAPPVDKAKKGAATLAGTTATVPLTFRTFDGTVRNVEAKIGDSLLVVAHENDLPAMEGTCGGNAGEWERRKPSYASPSVACLVLLSELIVFSSSPHPCSHQNAPHATSTLPRAPALLPSPSRQKTSLTCSTLPSTTATA